MLRGLQIVLNWNLLLIKKKIKESALYYVLIVISIFFLFKKEIQILHTQVIKNNCLHKFI